MKSTIVAYGLRFTIGFGLALFVISGAAAALAAPASVVMTSATQSSPTVTLSSSADVTDTYTVRFQNQGTAEEHVVLDVELYDPLSNKFTQRAEERVIAAGAAVDFALAAKFAPTARPGMYILKAAVFLPGWTGVAHWYDHAAETVVNRADGESVVGTGDATLSTSSLDKTTMMTSGDRIIGSATFVTDQKYSQPILIDYEVYKKDTMQMVYQVAWDNEVVSSASPITKKVALLDGTNPAGTYVWKIGVFKAGWNGALHWYDKVQEFQVGSTTPTTTPPPTATSTPSGGGDVQLTVSSAGTRPDGSRFLSTTLTLMTGTSANILVDAELHNSAGTKVYQTYNDNLSFTSGSPSTNLNFSMPAGLPPGTYTWKIGVFEAGWTKLLHWYDKAQVVTI
ncbi:hypothetical protein KW797_01725 [Candidatus Parcubacteria bacterium]|nr:hypothetical protein [Candidatus Parcubacteria bacterium]